MSYRPKILLIDNYDSFTYNLYDYFLQLETDCTVIRNDEKSVQEIAALEFDGLVFSPGPKKPKDAGNLFPLIKAFYQKKPLLGICLGHQAIGQFFGATLKKASIPVHGKTSTIYHQGHLLFRALPNHFEVMRYHSLILENLDNTPLQNIAQTSDEIIMALAHPTLPIYGVQFHPESILTAFGLDLLKNWLNLIAPPSIRIMTKDDIPTVRSICMDTFKKHNTPLFNDPQKAIAEFSKIVDTDQLQKRYNNNCHFMIAEQNGEIIGVLEIDKVSHIRLLYIKDRWQKKGVGLQLMNFALEYVRKQLKAKHLTLNSAPNAIAFYKKIGFKVTDIEQEENGIRYTPMLINL